MKKVILNFYDQLDCMVRVRENALSLMQELGKKYGEIEQFQRIPGIGVVGAHVFSAFIQTPHRFATKQQLWKYCQLGIRVRQSGGKKLSGECLDRSGISVLKAISYQCWMSSLRTKEPNEVSLFYHAFGETYARFDPCPVKYPAKSTCNTLDHLEKECRLPSTSFLQTTCIREKSEAIGISMYPCD